MGTEGFEDDVQNGEKTVRPTHQQLAPFVLRALRCRAWVLLCLPMDGPRVRQLSVRQIHQAIRSEPYTC